MWEELKAAVFDSSTPTGIKLSFMENMTAEVIGLLFGVVISFVVATLLDRLGNKRQFSPLRERLASQLARIHDEIFREISRPFNRAGNNGEAIAHSIRRLDEFVDQIDFGLTPKQKSQVQAYRARLQDVERIASTARHRSDALKSGFVSASQALRPALKQLYSGRLEPYWREVLAASFQDPAASQAPTERSWLASRDLTRGGDS